VVLKFVKSWFHCALPNSFGDQNSKYEEIHDLMFSKQQRITCKGRQGQKNRSIHVHTDLLWSDSLTLNLFDDGV